MDPETDRNALPGELRNSLHTDVFRAGYTYYIVGAAVRCSTSKEVESHIGEDDKGGET